MDSLSIKGKLIGPILQDKILDLFLHAFAIIKILYPFTSRIGLLLLKV